MDFNSIPAVRSENYRLGRLQRVRKRKKKRKRKRGEKREREQRNSGKEMGGKRGRERDGEWEVEISPDPIESTGRAAKGI